MLTGMLKMKNIIYLLIILISIEIKVQGQELTISWKKIDQQEKAAIRWIEAQEKDKIIQMGVSNLTTKELEWIKAFFPYLLPEQFFNRNLFLTCYPSFSEFRKEKNSQQYKKWQNCHLEIWRDSLPPLIKQATQDLVIN